MRLIYLLMAVTLFFTACSESNSNTEESGEPENIIIVNPKDVPKSDRLEKIEELEEALRNGGDQPDKKIARQLMAEYMDFYNFQHDEPETPEFLFRAGELARYVGRPKTAIKVYSNLFNSYPDFPRRVETLNLIAFIYDYDLNEKEEARKNYALLIENFPDHKLADDARARLETIDLSDEELIELFKKKNQAQ